MRNLLRATQISELWGALHLHNLHTRLWKSSVYYAAKSDSYQKKNKRSFAYQDKNRWWLSRKNCTQQFTPTYKSQGLRWSPILDLDQIMTSLGLRSDGRWNSTNSISQMRLSFREHHIIFGHYRPCTYSEKISISEELRKSYTFGTSYRLILIVRNYAI